MSWSNSAITIATFLPAVGAVVIALMPKEQDRTIRAMGIAITGAAMLVGLAMLPGYNFGASEGLQYELDVSWISVIGARYHVGIDGISLPLFELTLVLSVPCIAIAIAIPELVMRALFMRGAFTATDATAAAATLAAYAMGLLPFVLIRSFVAPFYARGDTWTPVKAALIAVLVNILLKIALMANLAQVGLALATAAGAWVNLVLLWLAAKRLGFKPPDTSLEGAMRLLFAGLVTGIALHFGVRLIGPWLSGLPRLREETLLLLVLILGAILYAALVTLLRGRTWLKSLLRDAGRKASV